MPPSLQISATFSNPAPIARHSFKTILASKVTGSAVAVAGLSLVVCYIRFDRHLCMRTVPVLGLVCVCVSFEHRLTQFPCFCFYYLISMTLSFIFSDTFFDFLPSNHMVTSKIMLFDCCLLYPDLCVGMCVLFA